ncbi:hypothetical protein SUGI_0384420 [Cryptomeria japonica]|nr:hypothetical protein SUGI_0384420 [Cryptomeria japonica]
MAASRMHRRWGRKAVEGRISAAVVALRRPHCGSRPTADAPTVGHRIVGASAVVVADSGSPHCGHATVAPCPPPTA